jgi:hypothetical protein
VTDNLIDGSYPVEAIDVVVLAMPADAVSLIDPVEIDVAELAMPADAASLIDPVEADVAELAMPADAVSLISPDGTDDPTNANPGSMICSAGLGLMLADGLTEADGLRLADGPVEADGSSNSAQATVATESAGPQALNPRWKSFHIEIEFI